MKRKILASVLALIIVMTTIFTVIPAVNVFAAQSDLATPTVTSLTCESVGVNIKWDKVSGATQYAVFKKTSRGWYRLARTSGTSYTCRNLTSGTSYTFTVRCCDANGNYTSKFYSKGWSTVWCSTPSISKTENVSGGIKLTWNTTTKAPAYRLFVKKNNSWTGITNIKSTNSSTMSYTYKSVSNNNSYTFTIRAITTDGRKWLSYYNPSGWTQTYKTTTTKLATPNFSLSNYETGVKISWTAVSGAAKYRVFYRYNNKWYKLTDTTNTSVKDDDVRSGNTYIYTVRCISADGKTYTSDYHSGKSIKYIAAPKLTLSNETNGIRLKWDAVKGASKYRLFLRESNGWKGFVNTTSTSYLYTANMQAGKTYTFTIRCVSSDGSTWESDFYSGWSITRPVPATQAPTVAPTQAPTQKPTEAPTQPATQPPTQPAIQPSTPTSYITPTVRVYDGKVTASWNAVSGANKYVVSISNDMVSSGTLETKTVTGTSATMNYTFTNTFSGSVVMTSVVAYKNSTALTKAKTVNTTIVGKWINSRSNDRIRSVFTIQRDINFCNSCGQWMENAYQTNLSGKLSTCAPYETDVNHQPWHTHKTGCPCTSYRCWLVNWPSGLMNYKTDDNVKFYKYYSVVDSNWSNDYYPTITSTVDIDSIKKVNFSESLHVQQLNNIESERGGTNDPLPLMQADGALEITFTPKDKNIKIYDIWVKTTNAKSVNKLTQLRATGDKLNGEYMYNAFDNRWTYDAELDNNDWAVIGQLVVTDTGYTSYSYQVTERDGKFTNKVVKTTNLSSLTYTLPNWYGNQYNSCYDWNMLDNNTKYEFAIQPRLDRTGKNTSYSDTVPAAPRGNSKSYTWTGRDYEYYTENNAYFLGASLRNQNIKTKPLEVYAEQRNLDWQTWGMFEVYDMGHDDHTGKDYIKTTYGAADVSLVNNYRIPIRTDFEHTGSIYEWKGTCDDGIYALSTRTAVLSHTATHTENATTTFTIASHGLYAKTSLYDVWSHRNEHGKHITLIDHKVNYYDPLCYEYTIDGGYKYYYEIIPDSWVKQRPKNYVAATPDGNAARKSTDTHLWDEIK